MHQFRPLLVALGLALVSPVAQSAPLYQRLSYTGDTATTMTITWNTTGAVDGMVRYGTASGALSSTVNSTSFQANAGLGTVHEATLTGLQPEMTYYYVVGSTADGFSSEATFKTGPAEEPNCSAFKFVFLGDNRPDPVFGGGENWPTIVGESIQQQPDFILNGGDMVIEGEEIDQWLSFLGWTETVSASRPFMPAIGNHDDGPGEGDGANYNQIFALPRSTGTFGSGTEDYYFFTYGNAIFVSLSSEGYKTGTPAFSDQASWLDEVLTNNPKKWKIVYYHKPTYTNEVFFDISHQPNEEGQNEAWVEVFDRHHVDVVLTSHNHWYERFEPSACGTQGDPGSDQPCPVGADNFGAGTVYYVSGGAGAFTIPEFLCGSQTGRAACSGDHHYIVFDINNEVLKIDAWSAYPQANEIIDTLTITKNADSCLSVPDGGVADAGPPPGPLDGGAVADGSSPIVTPPSDSGAVAADAGADTGGVPPVDSGSSFEAQDTGCGCRAGATSSSDASMLLLALCLGGLRHRRKHSAA
jgi:hypothetical protein